MGLFLYSLHLPNDLTVRAGSDKDRSHVSSQGVLAAISLVGGGTGDEEPEARARYETGLLLRSVALTTLLSVEYGPKLLEQKP